MKKPTLILILASAPCAIRLATKQLGERPLDGVMLEAEGLLQAVVARHGDVG